MNESNFPPPASCLDRGSAALVMRVTDDDRGLLSTCRLLLYILDSGQHGADHVDCRDSLMYTGKL